MENRTERVVIETHRHRIVGELTLPREGYRSRVSDYLNRGDVDFIPLVNARLTPIDGGDVRELEFIVVASAHVHIAYPESASDNGASPD